MPVRSGSAVRAGDPVSRPAPTPALSAAETVDRPDTEIVELAAAELAPLLAVLRRERQRRGREVPQQSVLLFRAAERENPDARFDRARRLLATLPRDTSGRAQVIDDLTRLEAAWTVRWSAVAPLGPLLEAEADALLAAGELERAGSVADALAAYAHFVGARPTSRLAGLARAGSDRCSAWIAAKQGSLRGSSAARTSAGSDPGALGDTFTVTRQAPLSAGGFQEHGQRGRRLVHLEVLPGNAGVTYHFVSDRRRLRYKVLDRATPLRPRLRKRLRTQGWRLVGTLSAAREARLPSRYQYIFLKAADRR